MIIDAIVEVLMGMISGVLGLFPAWSLGINLDGVGSSIGGALGRSSAFFPIGTLFICLSAIFGLKIVLFVWNFVVWLYRLIPAKFT